MRNADLISGQSESAGGSVYDPASTSRCETAPYSQSDLKLEVINGTDKSSSVLICVPLLVRKYDSPVK